jgi:hypothetical protein
MNEDSTQLQVSEQATLADLAKQINEAHRLCEAAMNTGLAHALDAGRLLLEAKRQCQHGTWLPWLKENFKGSKRTAQAYLRLHREYPQLKLKAHRVALLSMRQAIVNVANDTHIVYRHDEPIRGEIIDVWQKEQCQNARRAAARAEVHRTTRGAEPDPKPARKTVSVQMTDNLPVKGYDKTEQFALSCARCAITQLEAIKPNNPGRKEALLKVRSWIDAALERTQ